MGSAVVAPKRRTTQEKTIATIAKLKVKQAPPVPELFLPQPAVSPAIEADDLPFPLDWELPARYNVPEPPSTEPLGIVRSCYLLHFEPAFKHARHYLGCTDNLDRRLKQHYDGKGKGSPLVKAAIDAGCHVSLSNTWLGGYEFEQWIKKQKNIKRYCWICQETPWAKVASLNLPPKFFKKTPKQS